MSSLLQKALINARALTWYHSRDEEEKHYIRMEYAIELDCPYCEILLEMNQIEDIAFIWRKHRDEIGPIGPNKS